MDAAHNFTTAALTAPEADMLASERAVFDTSSVTAMPVGGSDLIETLQIIMDILLITLTVLLMLSFGCSLEVSHIRHHLARPISVTLAMLLHFVILPYAFYGIDQALVLDVYDQLSLAILTTCPAGGISNLYVHWVEGDLALGIIITATSTVLGLVFMPLNLWVFSRAWKDNLVLPYVQTSITLGIILIPVAVGMLISRRFSRVATWLSRVASVVATLLILATVGLSSYMYPRMYSSSWKTWLISACFTPISFLISYLIALSMRMPADIRRTIGITTCAKSIALCMTIIVVSFPATDYFRYLVLPELHSMIMILELTVFCAVYRLYRWCNGKYLMTSEHNSEIMDVVSTIPVDQEPISNGGSSVFGGSRNRAVNRRMSDSLILQTSISLANFKSDFKRHSFPGE